MQRDRPTDSPSIELHEIRLAPEEILMTENTPQLSSWWRQRTLAAALLFATLLFIGFPESSDLSASPTSIDKMYEAYARKFPDVRGISVDDLLTLGTDSFVLVDVRPPEERGVSSIPDSIAQHEFETHPETTHGKVVVLFCTVGYRSGLSAQKLQQQGYDVRNLRGGLLAWCHAGQPVVNASGPTNRVHVYGKKWNLLPAQYHGVW